MKALYGLLVLNPVTHKLWLCKAWFAHLIDASKAAEAKAKQHNTKVYLVRCVEVYDGKA